MELNLNVYHNNVCLNKTFNTNKMLGEILENGLDYHRLIIYDIYGIYVKTNSGNIYIGTDDNPFHFTISRFY